ncbi:uncharacterized protein LOC122292635 isoform X1 [Carya illinoinensis]|uniref:uncharacterized protein LOC122292635 isoform X1 n=1 Tax=Carya illinoinensis TaxID=32201 RepID=UPI001C72797B|nr:uncharacterized protein LOC122292635 isoform X1 [Carya illinoinensis]
MATEINYYRNGLGHVGLIRSVLKKRPAQIAVVRSFSTFPLPLRLRSLFNITLKEQSRASPSAHVRASWTRIRQHTLVHTPACPSRFSSKSNRGRASPFLPIVHPVKFVWKASKAQIRHTNPTSAWSL